MASAERNGIDDFAWCLPSSINGGARSADEVTAQITIMPTNQTWAPGPVRATNGSAANAAHESAATHPTYNPTRLTKGAILSAAIPIAVSDTVNTAWSSIKMSITVEGAIPTSAASFGR